MSNSTDFGERFSDGGIKATFLANLLIFGVLLVIFAILRPIKKIGIYEARFNVGDKAWLSPAFAKADIPKKGCNPYLYWIVAWADLSNEQILKASGLRSLLMLLFQRSMIIFSFIVAFFSLSLAFTVNIHGDYNKEQAHTSSQVYESGFYDWSTNNLAPEDPKLWAHFVALLLISLCAYGMVYYNLNMFRWWRQTYITELKNYGNKKEELAQRAHIWARQVARYSVMISNLPRQLTKEHDLKRFIEEYMYENSIFAENKKFVLDVSINLETSKILALHAQRKFYYAESKNSVDGEKVRTGGVWDKVCLTCCHHHQSTCGVEITRRLFYKQLTDEINKEIEPERKLVRSFPVSTGYAFVTMYDDRIAKHFVQNARFQGETAIHRDLSGTETRDTVEDETKYERKSEEKETESKTDHDDENQLKDDHIEVETKGGSENQGAQEDPYAAPRWFTACYRRFCGRCLSLLPRESMYSYPATKWEVESAPAPLDIVWENLAYSISRRRFYYFLYSLFRVAFVILWALTVSALTVWAETEGAEDLGPLISSYLPSLLVMVFHALLPSLLGRLLKWTGLITVSEIELLVMEHFFVFSVVSALVLPSIITLNWGEIKLESLAVNPFLRVIETMAKITSPAIASFYASFVIQYAFTGTMFSLLRILPLITRALLYLTATKPSGIEAAEDANWPCLFYLVYGNNLVILTITLFFALTMPIITPLGLLYFILKYCVERYLVSFVYPTPIESGKGGEMYAAALRKFVVIVALFQLAAFTTFFGKNCIFQAAFSLILVLVSWFVHVKLSARLNLVFMEDLWMPYSQRDKSAHQNNVLVGDFVTYFCGAYSSPGLVACEIDKLELDTRFESLPVHNKGRTVVPVSDEEE